MKCKTILVLYFPMKYLKGPIYIHSTNASLTRKTK